MTILVDFTDMDAEEVATILDECLRTLSVETILDSITSVLAAEELDILTTELCTR